MADDIQVGPDLEGTDQLDEQVENFTAFATGDLEDASPDAIIIMVMGLTGTGKSSFISACTGRTDVEIGHDLMSCTNSIGIFRGELDGHEFYLIDTPGFDDNRLPDYEILNTITTYLAASYVNGVQLNGVLYFHLITETRINRLIEHNIEMFKAICGSRHNANLAILTNMWAPEWKNGTENGKQKTREQEFMAYVPDIIADGGHILRQEDCDISTRIESSRAILKQVLEAWRYSKITLQIQSEIADYGEVITLGETTAGQVLQKYADERAEDLRQCLADPQVTLRSILHRSASGGASEQREKEDDFQSQLLELGKTRQEMRANLREIYEKERGRVLEELEALGAKWAAEMTEKEAEYTRKRQELAIARARNDESPIVQVQESPSPANADMALVTAQAAIQPAPLDPAHQMMLQQLAELQKDIRELREKKEKTSKVQKKVEGRWVPFAQTAMTGAFGLVGAAITSGMLCIIQ